MQTIELSDPTMARIQDLAATVHATPREAVHRAVLLMQYLLEAQAEGQKLTLEEPSGQRRKLVIAHYSDGVINIHADRIVL